MAKRKPKKGERRESIGKFHDDYFGVKNVAALNTFEHVRKLREELVAPESTNMLNIAWEILSAFYEVVERDDDERTAGTPIDVFNHYIDMGFYPPPEILIVIHEIFQRYFMLEGDISLEEAFFGPEQKWVGNEGARRAKNVRFIKFHKFFQLKRATAFKNKEKLPTVQQFYREWVDDYPFNPEGLDNAGSHDDEETFVRGYYRWLKEEKGNQSASDKT